jgi:NAD(P)-dependent dehydrogenase (short-subunit alcohol dehydrogenase family)
MSIIDASELLRPSLLQGVSVLLAGAPAVIDAPASLGDAVRAACAGLGARVCECELSLDAPDRQEESAIELAAQAAVERALADGGSVELLAVDSASAFARAGGGEAGGRIAGEGGGRVAGEGSVGPGDVVSVDVGWGDVGQGVAREALRACLDVSWNVTRAVANSAFRPDARAGRIVYLAPPADCGEYADAARAGLENLARTLSIEWARHRITAVAIAPGAAMASEVAALTAYLASPAGAYFSGCLLDLRGAAGREC